MNNHETIVIVEDDLDYHFIFDRVLKKIGISNEVVFFSNGKEALEYLRNRDNSPGIIFSDINMPVMNGIEFREALTKEISTFCKSIPFIFLSTTAREKEIKAAYNLSIQGFFEKGETMDDLEATFKLVFNYWGQSKKPEVCVG